LAVVAVVLAACLSFVSVVGTIIGMIFVVVCALRTSRRFRIGLVASIVVWLMLLTGGFGALFTPIVTPRFLPKPVPVYRVTKPCERDMTAEQKANRVFADIRGRGLWWYNAGTSYFPLMCSSL
jgi:Na+/H+ antiporter NhaA